MNDSVPPKPLPFPTWIRYPLLILAGLGVLYNGTLHYLTWNKQLLPTQWINNLPQAIVLIVVFLGAALFLNRVVKTQPGEPIVARRKNILEAVNAVPAWRWVVGVLIVGYLVVVMYVPIGEVTWEDIQTAPNFNVQLQNNFEDIQEQAERLNAQRKSTAYFLLGYCFSLLTLLPLRKRKAGLDAPLT